MVKCSVYLLTNPTLAHYDPAYANSADSIYSNEINLSFSSVDESTWRSWLNRGFIKPSFFQHSCASKCQHTTLKTHGNKSSCKKVQTILAVKPKTFKAIYTFKCTKVHKEILNKGLLLCILNWNKHIYPLLSNVMANGTTFFNQRSNLSYIVSFSQAKYEHISLGDWNADVNDMNKHPTALAQFNLCSPPCFRPKRNCPLVNGKPCELGQTIESLMNVFFGND